MLVLTGLAPPNKRDSDALNWQSLSAPPCDATQRRAFSEGVAQFNAGRFWHAHEAWETAWLRMGDTAQDDGEVVLRGLIQLAAACHCRATGRGAAAAANLAKAADKLRYYEGDYWGLGLADGLAQVQDWHHRGGGAPLPRLTLY